MVKIPGFPLVRPEMFQTEVRAEDENRCSSGNAGKVRPLLFDASNGGWISLLKAEAVQRLSTRVGHTA